MGATFVMILIVCMKTQEDFVKLKCLGAKIRDMRLKLGLTQCELADKCGLDRNYIGMLERGERNPSYLTMLRLYEGLGFKGVDLH